MSANNNKRQTNEGLRLFTPILMVGVLCLGACNNNDDNDVVVTGGTTLSFLIKDDRKSDQPLAGVTVALYEIDNATIAETKLSDVNGIVNFGDVGRERVTIAVAHESEVAIATTSYTQRVINSYIDVQAADNITLYVQEPREDIEMGLINITFDLTQVPAGVMPVDILPLSVTDWSLYVTGPGVLEGILVYNHQIQDDGTLSLLVLGTDGITTNLAKWDMLIDQAFVDGATYTMGLTQDPIPLNWTTSPTTDLSSISIVGVRKGVVYDLEDEIVLDPPVSSGSIPFPMDFPLDKYWIYGEADISAQSYVNSTTSYTTLPLNIEVPLPDYRFDSVAYDTVTRTLSWTLSGTTSRDTIGMFLYGEVDPATSIKTEWNVVMAPDRTSWRVMELPAPADSWIDLTSLATNFVSAALEAKDFDVFTGYDEVWNHLSSGGDPYAAAGIVLEGGYDFITTITQFKDAMTE